MPIVETPHDAAACFLTTGIGYLILHDELIAKSPFHRVLAPLIDMYSDVAVMVRTGVQAN